MSDIYHRWRQYNNKRTWRQRAEHRFANWEPVMPSVVAAYLQWKYPVPCTTPPQRSTSPLGTRSPTPDENAGIILDICAINIYQLGQTRLRVQLADTSVSPSVDLAQHGYICNSPVSPSFAVSVKTLELYRRLRMRKPSFSAEAFAKVICDLHSVSLVYLHHPPLPGPNTLIGTLPPSLS